MELNWRSDRLQEDSAGQDKKKRDLEAIGSEFLLLVIVSFSEFAKISSQEMAFPQLGYPQYLSASQAVYAADRQGVLASSRGGAELGANPAAAVTSVLGMYANPYTAQNYSAFLPYTTDLTMFSQMGSQYELKDNPGVHPATFAAHAAPAYYPYGQFQYGDPARPKNATRESTSTLKAWLNEHRKNPYPTKGKKNHAGHHHQDDPDPGLHLVRQRQEETQEGE